MKKVLIVVSAVLVLFIAAAGFFLFQYRAELNAMRPLPSGKITDDLYAIKTDFVNLYLVACSDEEYFAIDAGTSNKKALSEMEKLGISPAQVKAVFLTHSDFDHTAGLSIFDDAIVYLSKQEEQMVNGNVARGPGMRNKLSVPYTLLSEEPITLGNCIVKGVSTPGHTPGSICYVVNDRYLFTGDCIKLDGNRAELFNARFNMDGELQKRSILKLKNIPSLNKVFTAHYGSCDYKELQFN